MKIKRIGLYDVIGESLGGEYSIGMHGIDERRLNFFFDGMTREEAIRIIIGEGLR